MINKNMIFIYFSIFFSVTAQDSSIIIRPAQIDELTEILKFDWHVSIEFFKPLFMQYYADLPFGKNAGHYLRVDVDHDEDIFINSIKEVESSRLYIAYDQADSRIAGLILFHQEESSVEIDLLLVAKEYRRMGIGKKLVQAACSYYQDSQFCSVYAFKRNQEALKFYTALGFDIQGPGPEDKYNSFYDMSYAELYLYCVKQLID